jgi:rod shape-determining protein MreD
MRNLGFLIAGLALLIVQGNVYRALDGVPPSVAILAWLTALLLVLPLVLFMGVHEYSLSRGAAVSFVLGYATDLLGIAPVGLYTFTYVATFVLARAVGVRLAAQTTWMQVLFVGAFSLLQSTMLLVLLAIFGRDVWVPKALYPLAVPHAIATAAVAPLVFRLAERLDSAAGGKLRAEAGAAMGS